MDLKQLTDNLKENLLCSICLGYLTDPVTVQCGHSFCTVCLIHCKEGAEETLTCPECRGIIRYSDLVPNRNLQNLSMMGKILRPHLLQSMVGLTLCEQHWERKKFFCEEDQRLLCDSCLSAPEHEDHHLLRVETATRRCKHKLQETQEILQSREAEFKVALENVRSGETICKEDAYTMKQSIISEYGKMHQFLWDEEHQYLKRLDRECTKNLVTLEESKARLSHQLQNLQRLIAEVEEHLGKVPLDMLQSVTGPLERSEELLLLEPEIPSLSVTTCSITGLREVLRSFQSNITLDADTANPHLILSEDLKRVQCGSTPQDLTDNPERFDCVLAVLGDQTFTSGKHYWEVEVGEKTEWELGVCKDSVSRKGKLSSSADVRTLWSYTSGHHSHHLNSYNDFQLNRLITKVGIFLDYGRGHIAFYSVSDGCLVYSLSDVVFEEPLRPYFSFGMPKEKSTPGSLFICPINNQ